MENQTKKILKILLPIIVILLVIIGIFAYIKMQSKPSKLFANEVNKVAQKLNSKEEIGKTKLDATINLDINSQSKKIAEINDFIGSPKITLNMEQDISKEITKFNIAVNTKGEEIINLESVLQDNSIYLLFKDFFDKYIEVKEEDAEDKEESLKQLDKTYDAMKELSKKDINKFINDVEKTVKDYLKKQKYKTSKETIKIEGKEIKANKITLSLGEKEYAELITKILETVKKNEKIVKALEVIDEDILQDIEDEIEYLKDEISTNEKMQIALYTKGLNAKVIQKTVILKDEYEGVFSATIQEINKNNVKLKMNIMDEEIIFKITKKNDKIEKISLVPPQNLEGTEAYLEMKETGKNKGISTIFVKIPVKYMEDLSLPFDDDIELKVTIEYAEDFNANVEKEDVSNAVDINKISEQEQEEIMKKIEKSKIYEMIAPSIKEYYKNVAVPPTMDNEESDINNLFTDLNEINESSSLDNDLEDFEF